MENTYAIIWVAKQRGQFGVGTKRFSREEAENLAAELNESHQGFLHGAWDTAKENQGEALASLRTSVSTSTNEQLKGYPDLAAAQAAAAMPTVLMPQPEEKIVLLPTILPEILPAAGE